MKDFKEIILRSYIETALWTEMLDDYAIDSIDQDSLKEVEKDIETFIEKAGYLLDGLDPSQVGHDFLLTRNSHGAGFWDGDYEKEVGEKLTEISKSFKLVVVFELGENKFSIE